MRPLSEHLHSFQQQFLYQFLLEILPHIDIYPGNMEYQLLLRSHRKIQPHLLIFVTKNRCLLLLLFCNSPQVSPSTLASRYRRRLPLIEKVIEASLTQYGLRKGKKQGVLAGESRPLQRDTLPFRCPSQGPRRLSCCGYGGRGVKKQRAASRPDSRPIPPSSCGARPCIAPDCRPYARRRGICGQVGFQ